MVEGLSRGILGVDHPVVIDSSDERDTIIIVIIGYQLRHILEWRDVYDLLRIVYGVGGYAVEHLIAEE